MSRFFFSLSQKKENLILSRARNKASSSPPSICRLLASGPCLAYPPLMSQEDQERKGNALPAEHALVPTQPVGRGCLPLRGKLPLGPGVSGAFESCSSAHPSPWVSSTLLLFMT